MAGCPGLGVGFGDGLGGGAGVGVGDGEGVGVGEGEGLGLGDGAGEFGVGEAGMGWAAVVSLAPVVPQPASASANVTNAIAGMKIVRMKEDGEIRRTK